MSLGSFTNKVGTHSKWPAFLEKNYNPLTGESNERVSYFRTEHSHKSDTQRPTWIRDGGKVVFKTPSPYLRVVDNRTNPVINGRHSYPDGRVFNVYQCHASDRAGNPPALSNMPRIMQDNSDYPYWDDNQVARAEIECLLKFREEGAQLGNALAEAASTIDMFADTASHLAKVLINLKKGNFKPAWAALMNGRSLPGFAASNYLQWKFGWAPLMGDMRDSLELFKKQVQVDNLIVSNVRNLRVDNKWDFQVGGNAGVNRVYGNGVNITTVKLWCRLDPNGYRRAGQAMGLDNPLGILWELTPWSFVVDWVLPVGSFLEALMTRSYLDFVGGYAAVKGQGSNRIVVPKWPDPLAVENRVEMKIDRFGYRRVPYHSLPFPRPYVKSPFSTSHTVTAVALLTQLAKL